MLTFTTCGMCCSDMKQGKEGMAPGAILLCQSQSKNDPSEV